MKYIYDEDGTRIGECILYAIDSKPTSTSGKTIGLVIGHDIKSQGAYGNYGISEFNFNSEFINDLQIEGYLPNQHKYIIYYRDSDISGYGNKMIDLHRRMDRDGVDISIEFHFNGASDASVNGHEVLYCSTDGSGLAKKLDKALDNIPNRDRGIKRVSMSDNGGGFCCRGKSVAILTEPFFGAHQSKFTEYGKYRKILLKAYEDFFNSI